MDIWQWTLTKEAIAPCFVRDVLDMRQSGSEADFFWLGHTPCRTVLLVGMVVAVQTYDKRAIYTVDDGTAVVDCVLRHSAIPAPRSPVRPTGDPSTKSTARRPSPTKQPLSKTKTKTKTLEPMEPPPPVTEPGYPVRVVGRVVRHYESKQIQADSIEPCSSSLDEIAHLERVIELHRTKYSLAIPFVLPPKPPRVPPPETSTSTSHTGTSADANVFTVSSRPLSAVSYTLPVPPRMPVPPQNRNRPPPVQTHVKVVDHKLGHDPSSPTASSVASSTPSSPCKSSSPSKLHETTCQPKLRHPSRLHSRDLTANTFRLYVKHYMDNAPSFSVPSWSYPLRGASTNVTTPTKRARFGERDIVDDEPTPRPRHHLPSKTGEIELDGDGEDGPTLGFTLSHLRRVPELALLAARVVRAETRKREKAERDKTRNVPYTVSALSSGPNGLGAAAEAPRKKMKRLFSWAVVKLYEEGSVVLWDGEVRPLPVPPPPAGEGLDTSGIWNDRTNTLGSVDPSMVSTCGSRLALYDLSASASLYSHYHAPRRRDGEVGTSEVDDDVDPAALSDPGIDEEAYVPLSPQFLAAYVKDAMSILQRGHASVGGGGTRSVTAAEVLRYMQRMDGRWARLGVWVVEEALAVLRSE